MKHIGIFFFIVQLLAADDGDWRFERLDFYFENDADVRTDRGYTDGSRLAMLLYRPQAHDSFFNIPFTGSYHREHFISFSAGQQIFTPEDLTATGVVEDDRPYAGWLYTEIGLHQSSERHLDSLSMQIGVVGHASQMEKVQKFIHDILGSDTPEGWDNQLDNELGLQLNYEHKWRFVPDTFWGVESSIVPYLGGEFGNIAIQANAGGLARLGWNIPQDFGNSPIDYGGESGVPIGSRINYCGLSDWSFYLNFSLGGSLVARDIFLDGNTFSDSHSVEKYNVRGYGGYGFSVHYWDFSLDYFRTYYTKEYVTQKENNSYGSLLFSYHF